MDVWHLAESGSGAAGEFKDSTSSNNHGRGGGGTGSKVPTQTTGRIGNAQSFDGGDYVDVGTSIASLTNATWSAWVQPTANSTESVIGKWVDNDGWLIATDGFGGSGKLELESPNNENYDSASNVPLSSWTRISVTADGTNVRFYLDDVLDATRTQNFAISNAGVSTWIGSLPDFESGWYFHGIIDEVRISNVTRTTDWITAEYYNQSSPANFHSVCGEELAPTAVTSAVAEINPNYVITSSTGNAFSYDIQAIISGGDTGVNRVAITVPGSFGAPTVTEVQVDGVSVAYTDSTVSNALSVDLTTKVTTSSRITVLFNADAPATQDLTGVD
ncbi:MAG: LamG domain-containing protein, partial [Lysobacterales bacterium]